jgi:GT2 family glycosyltransferase
MRTTVLITLLNDTRAVRAVESALAQGPQLTEIVVADGGSKPENLMELVRRSEGEPRIRIVNAPGSVAESRNTALAGLKTDIVAFLDADEVAPPGWLATLTEPIRTGAAEFTGGPTKPLAAARSNAERYINSGEERLYRDHVPNDLALLPMGNSAWRVDLLRAIGGFDSRLAWGGEDYDVNLRALKSGARGVFVPNAFVFHDQSHLDGFGKVLRRKRRYYFGAATAYIKNDVLRGRSTSAAKRFQVHHPIDLLDVVLKPWALVKARRYARRAFRDAK